MVTNSKLWWSFNWLKHRLQVMSHVWPWLQLARSRSSIRLLLGSPPVYLKKMITWPPASLPLSPKSMADEWPLLAATARTVNGQKSHTTLRIHLFTRVMCIVRQGDRFIGHVQWHIKKEFTKDSVRSRSRLGRHMTDGVLGPRLSWGQRDQSKSRCQSIPRMWYIGP